MVASISAAAVAKVSIGNTEIRAISLGSAELWTGAKFEPVKATLSSGYSAPTSFGQVSGWAADTANYPKSVVSGGKQLQIPNPGTGVTVTATIRFNNPALGTPDATLRLNIDGTLVTGSATRVGSSNTAVSVTAVNVTLKAGSLISVDSTATQQYQGWAASAVAGATSFIWAYIPGADVTRTKKA
ncbi:hypothetical protein [Nocardia sp. NPDC004722]